MSSIDLTDDELAGVNERLEGRSTDAVRWAVESFHPYLALASSMTDAVLIDLAVKVEPDIEVVFIDTGYHFPETLETLERVRRRYGLNLRVMTFPPQPLELWRVDPVNCCSEAKVAQLSRALAGKQAWMSGVRRAESATRRNAAVVARDRRGLVKINPIVTWSDRDVEEYIRKNDVPVNPLLRRGYASVGCQPCTQPIVDGADPRSGRWVGSEKTECGLHV